MPVSSIHILFYLFIDDLFFSSVLKIFKIVRLEITFFSLFFSFHVFPFLYSSFLKLVTCLQLLIKLLDKRTMFSRGPNTLQVSAQLFVENRARLVKALKDKTSPGSVVVLEGGVEKNRYNTDAEDLPFRQVCKLTIRQHVNIAGILLLLGLRGARKRMFRCH